jgi:hypothetical protein
LTTSRLKNVPNSLNLHSGDSRIYQAHEEVLQSANLLFLAGELLRDEGDGWSVLVFRDSVDQLTAPPSVGERRDVGQQFRLCPAVPVTGNPRLNSR